MELKINSIRYIDNGNGKEIGVVVDIIGDDHIGLAQTWVEIPYDEKITAGEIQDLSFNLAKDKLKLIVKDF